MERLKSVRTIGRTAGYLAARDQRNVVQISDVADALVMFQNGVTIRAVRAKRTRRSEEVKELFERCFIAGGGSERLESLLNEDEPGKSALLAARSRVRESYS